MSFEPEEIHGIAEILNIDSSTNLPTSSTFWLRIKNVLEMILESSIHTVAFELFTAEDTLILKRIGRVLEANFKYEETILSILINISAESSILSEKILSINAMKFLKEIGLKSSETMLRVAQLISNLSRHFSKIAYTTLNEQWSIYEIIEILTIEKPEYSSNCVNYFGYVLMNYSTIPEVRQQIARNGLERLLSLLSLDTSYKKKYSAVNVLYNLSFDDELHTFLLEEGGHLPEDTFLAAIVAPLTDKDYNLSDEETDKLPLPLQYYDKSKDSDGTIRHKLLQTLYQFCATKSGRETLRKKGIYAILRELDRDLNGCSGDVNDAKNLKLLSNNISQSDWGMGGDSNDETQLLHAIIGILIRYENEMEIPNETFSLRDLA